MGTTPVWQGATTGQPALAAQVNQFLAAHNSIFLYPGTQRAAQTTGAGIYQSTQTQYLAQSFTTAIGQTSIGAIWLQVSTFGGSPTSATIPPLTVGLYASGNGAPTGSVLASTSIAEQNVYASPFWLQVPMPVAVAASTTYQIVVSQAGSSGHYYLWQQSNQTSGASTSATGAAWASQGYGLMFQVYDRSSGGVLQGLYDDGGARVTQFSYNAQNLLSSITESVMAQDGSVATFTRSLSYSGGILTGVS